MKAGKWPFRPVHITNDGEKCPVIDPGREDLSKLTGVGIIPNEHLQGIETSICANLRYPTTIIEFPSNGKPVRTDSPLLDLTKAPFGLHPPCRILRGEIDGKYCLECDNAHAVLFKGLSESNLASEIPNRISSSEYIQDYLSSEPRPRIRFVNERNKVYLKYDCPLLGYREITFPCFFEGKVVAVFFIGQICLKDNLDMMIQLRKKFFHLHDLASHPAAKKIEQEHDKWINVADHLLEEDEYQKLINKAYDEVQRLENTLNEQMDLQRGLYIRKRIDVRVKEFRKNLPDEDASSKDKQARLWHNVEQRVNSLLRDFAIKYVVIFGSESLTRGRISLLNMVAKAGDLPEELLKSIESGQLNFNMNNVPEKLRGQWVTTVEDPKIFKALGGWQQYDPATNLVRVFPVPLFSHAALVVMVGYHEWNPLMSNENSPKKQLSVALQTFYTVVLSAFSSVLASTEEEQREKALGRLTHELKGPIVAIRGSAEFMMRTPGIDKFFDYDYPGDIWSWTELMGRLIDNADTARYSDEKMRVKAELIYLVRDVIAPAIKQVRLLLDEREFSRHNIEYKHEHFDQIPKLLLDRNQFQQVIFNLLSNAIKYAYDDPAAFSVEIDASDNGKHFLILFSDWGPGIELGMEEKIFEEGIRGKDAFKMDVAGQGLGLWIVRQVVRRHNGMIKVTNLHLPTEFTIFLPHSLTATSLL